MIDIASHKFLKNFNASKIRGKNKILQIIGLNWHTTNRISLRRDTIVCSLRNDDFGLLLLLLLREKFPHYCFYQYYGCNLVTNGKFISTYLGSPVTTIKSLCENKLAISLYNNQIKISTDISNFNHYVSIELNDPQFLEKLFDMVENYNVT